MNRAVPAIILVLAAIMAIIMKAPPKARENIQTYYKTLIQAPAAQMTVFTARTVAPRPAPKVVTPPSAKPATHSDGPQITVLGGVAWDRKPRPVENLASHPESHAGKTEPAVAAVEPPQPPEAEPAPSPEQ